MYRWIVKNKVKATFKELSAGNNDFLINQFAKKFTYTFVGDTALSGTRTSVDSMRRWFERLDTIFTDLTFVPVSVEVGGMPWNTTVLSEVIVTATLAGKSYENIFFQKVTLSSGKVTSVLTLEDTQHLSTELQQAFDNGLTEAQAAPIED